MDYPGRVSLMWESRSSNGRKIEGQDRGIIFYGEKGSLDTGGDNYTVYDLDGKLVKEIKSLEDADVQGRNTASPSLGMDNLHVMDFLDAIRTNRRPNCDVETGYKSVVAMQLGNIAWRTGRGLAIDPKNGHIIGDSDAQKHGAALTRKAGSRRCEGRELQAAFHTMAWNCTSRSTIPGHGIGTFELPSSRYSFSDQP